MADEKAFGAGRQQHAAAGFVEGLARGGHPRDGLVEIVERLVAAARRILHREPGDAGLGGAEHIGRHPLGLIGIGILEIGIHRNLGRRDEGLQMRQHPLQPDAVVGQRQGPGIAGAGGGQRLEARLLQPDGRARVPGIGNDEAAGLMQPAEGGAAIGDGNGHGEGSFLESGGDYSRGKARLAAPAHAILARMFSPPGCHDR